MKGIVMSKLRKAVLALRVLMVAKAFIITPAAAANFDGQWSIQIASTNSACGSGANLAIGINNGKVESSNAMLTASGSVAEVGAIRVMLANGIKRAIGAGRLSGSSGSSTSHGAMCSGTWTAQRV
jgi:hypothetical protein